MPITDEDRAYVRSRLGTPTSSPSSSGRGMFGRSLDYLGGLADKFDPDWLPAGDDYSGADYLYNNVSRPLGAVTKGVMKTGNWLGQAAFGGPVRTLGTVASFGTAPVAGAVLKGLSSAPKVGRAVTAGAKTLHNINRGADALQATSQGAQAIHNVSEGNLGEAAANVAFGYLGGKSARTPYARPVTRGVKPAPGDLTQTPDIFGHMPDVNGQTVMTGERVRDMFGMEPKEALAKGLITSEVQQGTKGYRVVQQPTKSPDELLTERVNALGKKPLPVVVAGRVPQAARELQVLGIDPTPENIRKHLNQSRQKINEATQRANAIQPGVSTDLVTPPARHSLNRRLVTRNIKEAGLEATPENVDWVISQRKKLNDAVKILAKERAAGNTSTIQGTLDAGRKIGDEPLTNAIDAVEAIEPNRLQREWDSTLTSMETEMDKQGDRGKLVADAFRRVRTDSPIRFEGYAGQGLGDELRLIGKGKHKTIKQDRFEKIVDYYRGDTKIVLNEDELKLVDKIRGALTKAQQDLLDRGLIEEIDPNRWPEEWQSGLKGIRKDLEAKGLNEDEIQAKMSHISKTREHRVGLERAPTEEKGFRKDPNVLIEALRDTAHRVEKVDNFGAKDLNDPDSIISKLIANSESPKRMRELVGRSLRGNPRASETTKSIIGGLKTWATASALSQASISQIAGMVPILARSGIRNTANGLVEAFKKDEAHGYLRNMNAYRDFSSHFDDSKWGDFLYKKFGIEGMQNAMNHWAGRTGLAEAKTLFEKLKQNPSHELTRTRLRDLILDDINMVLKQDDLSDKQLQRAMTRMAEITQGSPDLEKLPYHWQGDGFRQIPQIFMKMGFQGTKAIKDGFAKEDWHKTLPKVIGGGLLAGELIGDVKEIPKTVGEVAASEIGQALDLTGDNRDFFPEYWENIGGKDLTASLSGTEGYGKKPDDTQDRFQYTRRMLKENLPKDIADWAENEDVVRAVSNVINSYTFGMGTDALLSAAEMASSRSPETASLKPFWAWDEYTKFMEGLQDIRQGNLQDPGREFVRRLPIFGSGATRAIPTYRESEKGLKAGSGGFGGRGKYKITYADQR